MPKSLQMQQNGKSTWKESTTTQNCSQGEADGSWVFWATTIFSQSSDGLAGSVAQTVPPGYGYRTGSRLQGMCVLHKKASVSQ